MPLRMIALFWSATLFLFYVDLLGAYGAAPNKLLLLLFMLPHISILLFINYVKVPSIPALMVDQNKTIIYFKVSLLVSGLMLPLNIYFYTGSSLSEFTTLLTDPLEAYGRMHLKVSDGRSERTGFLVLKLLLSWITVCTVPLAIILHRNKIISIYTLFLALVLSFILSVFRGTDKELADIMVFFVGSLFLGRATVKSEVGSVGTEKFKLISKQGMLIFSASAVFLYFFVFRKSERLAEITVHCFQNTSVCMNIESSQTSPATFLFTMLYRYATHGYYGLAASFDTLWAPCPFTGHSRVLTYLSELFGNACAGGLIEQLDTVGWTSRGAWSTGFTQLAADFGHLATYMHVIFFALSLKIFHRSFVTSGCYLSGVLYLLNFFILFYMVGNLQLQQVGEQYFGYIFLNTFALAVVLKRNLSRS